MLAVLLVLGRASGSSSDESGASMRAIRAEKLPSTERFAVTDVRIEYNHNVAPVYELGKCLPVGNMGPSYAIVDLRLRVDDLTFLGDLARLPAFEGWLAVDDIPHTPSPVPRCPWCGVLRESDAVKCRHCGGPF